MSNPATAQEIPVWRDPADVFAAHYAGAADCFWLDAGPDAESGWSWMGPGLPEGDTAIIDAQPLISPTTAGVPGAFAGGWVGWLGYDGAAARAGVPSLADDRDGPQEVWLRTTTFLAFDHAARRWWAVGECDAVVALARRVADTSVGAGVLGRPPRDLGLARGRHTPDEYASLIASCREAIREGDAYQLCLTTRFDVDTPADPLAAYLALRSATPAHHGGYIRVAEWALISASPERFLEVVPGALPGTRSVRTHPIKGTRPRGSDPASDAHLVDDLVGSAKERAENIMIVDLMRNDLSRVCSPGSVGVERLLAVESYPAVHQLVSTVSGNIAAGATVGDLLAAAFPAGSMTGAPKLSAMTILRRLEGHGRGVYSGCFGWVGADGRLDLAMVIRSIVSGPRGAYVGAGGGITWRSDAAAEVEEVGIKARGPLAALGAALPPGWGPAKV